AGMGAQVTILDLDVARLRELDEMMPGRVKTVVANSHTIERTVRYADLLIGADLVPGSRAPKVVPASLVAEMKRGAVVVDVAVDQGGCVETIDHATTHSDPTYVRDGVVHYAVSNMPGAVPRTATQALSNSVLPYVLEVAD